jgi:hypothetical protein
MSTGNAGGEARPSARLRRLTVRDFRNLADVTLEVPFPGLALVGDNGHGKTNLLEAIYYLHLFRSLRGARDVELVRFGRAGFHVLAVADGVRWNRIGAGGSLIWSFLYTKSKTSTPLVIKNTKQSNSSIWSENENI